MSKEVTPLSTMLGSGDFIEIAGKQYVIRAIKLKDIPEFEKDNLNFGPQYFSLAAKKEREKIDKWLSRYVFNAAGEPMTLDKATEEDWDVTDIKTCLLKLVDISG